MPYRSQLLGVVIVTQPKFADDLGHSFPHRRKLLRIAHATGGEKRFPLRVPGNELAKVFFAVAQRFVDEQRQAGLDERPCPLDVFPTAIGGNDHRINLLRSRLRGAGPHGE